MFTRWQAEGGESSGNVGRFCLWMVNHRYLTEYQAAMLARGHAEGFFLDSYKVLDRLGKHYPECRESPASLAAALLDDGHILRSVLPD